DDGSLDVLRHRLDGGPGERARLSTGADEYGRTQRADDCFERRPRTETARLHQRRRPREWPLILVERLPVVREYARDVDERERPQELDAGDSHGLQADPDLSRHADTPRNRPEQ